MTSVASPAVAPMANDFNDDDFIDNHQTVDDLPEEKGGVFIECYTAPNTSDDDEDGVDDASLYYEEEVIDGNDNDDDDLTVDHTLDSYEEVTIGEDEELLDDEEEVVSDDEEIVELSETDDVSAHGDRDGILDESMGGCDDSSVAMASVDSTQGNVMGDTLHNQMQSAITEGARKAKMEQLAREQTLKDVAERRQKQRELLQQETEKLKTAESQGVEKEPNQKDGAARNTLMKEIQRINDAVSKNKAHQANAAQRVHKTADLETKNKALIQLRRQAARDELAKKNEAMLAAAKAKSDALTPHSPRSVSQHQGGSPTRETPSSSGKYRIGLAKLSSLDSMETPLNVEEEDSCIESNADQSQQETESKKKDDITSNEPKNDKSNGATEAKQSAKAAKPITLACVLPGNYSTVSKKKILWEAPSIEETLDDSTIVKSVITNAVDPTAVPVEASTADKVTTETDDNTLVECKHDCATASADTMDSPDVDCTEATTATVDTPALEGRKGTDHKEPSPPPPDAIDASVHSLATPPAQQPSREDVSSPQTATNAPVVSEKKAKSLIQAFESPKKASTPSSPAKSSACSGQLPIPPAFLVSPKADSSKNVSIPSPSKPRTFSPRKMTAQVPSAFKTFEKKKATEEASLAMPLPFAADSSGDYHSLQDLQSGKAQDIDIARREQYLSPAEFLHHFKMSKEEFAKLPKWKRDKTKRALKLF